VILKIAINSLSNVGKDIISDFSKNVLYKRVPRCYVYPIVKAKLQQNITEEKELNQK
jgi:hypothetical protein